MLNLYANFAGGKKREMMDDKTPMTSSFEAKQQQLSEDIAQRIVTLLKQRHMSQRDLAHALGKTETEVSRWLSGHHNLTLATIAKMATVLGDDIVTTTSDRRRTRRYPDVAATYAVAAEEETRRQKR